MAPVESPHTPPKWDAYCTWGGWGEQVGCRHRRIDYSMYCPMHLRPAIARHPNKRYAAALLQAIEVWEQEQEKTD
jgi:hypothetical protein